MGPESTGKSMLSEKMAAHYGTIWVKEYAREYLLTHGKNYSFENLLDIARGQIREEEAGIRTLQSLQAGSRNQKPLFIDTDMYVMKVWCEFVFDKCHHWILNRIAERHYDLYLLCNIDVPWVEDELREYPDLESRRKLYHYYKDLLVNQHVPWVEISGDYEERLQKAIAAVDALTG
ncbi:MAG TPA: AAA family ATPase [Ferruginibacter sp.]|nr:AAA family ATPase [Ferruginibacter sp.]